VIRMDGDSWKSFLALIVRGTEVCNYDVLAKDEINCVSRDRIPGAFIINTDERMLPGN
jgi:hypothetical protein